MTTTTTKYTERSGETRLLSKPCSRCNSPTRGVDGFFGHLCPACREDEQNIVEGYIEHISTPDPALPDFCTLLRDATATAKENARRECIRAALEVPEVAALVKLNRELEAEMRDDARLCYQVGAHDGGLWREGIADKLGAALADLEVQP